MLGACSREPETAKAPPGAMESFAAQQSANEAADEAEKIESLRAREAQQAADERQKVQAKAGMDGFEKAEKAAGDLRTKATD